ncbi:MAG: peptidyl-prolyl cis-trans isomerase [Clostridium sp.]|nr:peptidyl-prolyl cis-trans isomerase [Acetatifactor muris]MCM1528077.1 peptidyl-prolyl cis-trans isomerase [Bacteroides sp.]MCM1564289.1 peptidyl-prolyl cis-trans isomerase [Clostridium sp.]
MSNKKGTKQETKGKKGTANSPEKEKVVTKYDLKMQRRQAEKEKERKRQQLTKGIGIVAVVALVAFVLSFPIRNYLATHETYVTINGEDITRAEFDYNYHAVVNDYVGQYGDYLGLFGLDVSGDFSKQMYSETLTWQDYFEEMTVDNMKRTKGLKAEADAAGYEFDTAQEIEEFKSAVQDAAKETGVSSGTYIRQLYGSYATMNSVTAYIAESVRVNAYYQQLSEGMAATDEEISAYYRDNADDYDSVDYYMEIFNAELSSEAPTDEEIAAAMEAAYDLADAAQISLRQTGEERLNVRKSSAPYIISDWLFDAARKSGDTTVLPDTSNNLYYAVRFENRYLDEAPTADIRALVLQDVDGQAVLDEWKAGEATESSFEELCDRYTEDETVTGNGALFTGLTESGVSEDLAEWIFAEGRQTGDTTVINSTDGYIYVMYYVAQGKAAWQTEIADTLLMDAQTEYMDALAERITVEDKKGKLNYLKVQAEQENADGAEGGVSDETGAGAESGDADGAESSAENPAQ